MAGVNYLMGIPMGDDVMLNYQTTSFHNNAALRDILSLRPAPEFERWMEDVGLWRNGKLTKKAGDPSIFGVASRGALSTSLASQAERQKQARGKGRSA